MKNRKFWNKCLALALSTAMICSSGSVAFAAEFTSGEDIATEQATETGGAISEDVTQPEETEEDFTAPQTEEFDSGAPEVEEFGDEGSSVAAESNSVEPSYTWYTSAQTDATEYQISTVADLLGFANIVNGTAGENGTVRSDFDGKTVKLVNDIDLTGIDWVPVGNVTSYPGVTFKGTFDGGNHTVSNMTTTDNTKEYASAGFFGSVYGIIQNLTLRNIKVTSSHYAGGIVGYSSVNTEGMKIENCHVDGGTITSSPELKDSKYDNGDKVGGIIGYYNKGTVTDCSVANVTIKGYRDIGGIVGYTTGTVSNNTVGQNVKIIQDATNGYKDPLPATVNSILGRDEGATLENNSGTAEITRVGLENMAAKVGETYYCSFANAIEAAEDSTVTLLSNITLSATQTIDKNLTLDLNGKTITGTGITPIVISANVTIKDTSTGGAIKNNSNATTDADNESASVKLTSRSLTLESGTIGDSTLNWCGLDIAAGTTFKMTGGQVLAGTNANYAVRATGAEGINTSVNISGGEINCSNNDGYGLRLLGNYNGLEDATRVSHAVVATISDNASISGGMAGAVVFGKGSKLTMSGGKITGKFYGISGNGSRNENNNRSGTVIEIAGGTVEATDSGDSVGIYHPQLGSLQITGGTIKGNTGIEIRSGKLTISGGDVIGTGNSISVTANGNGQTTKGAGIAIAQHTTKLPINVTVSDGKISGYSAVYESNPQNPEKTDFSDVTLSITNGYFRSTGGSSLTIYSQDKTGFISGGYFSQYLDSKYLAKEREITAFNHSEYPYQVEEGSASTTDDVKGVTSGKTEATAADSNNFDAKLTQETAKTAAESIKAPEIAAVAAQQIQKDGVENESKVTSDFEAAKQNDKFQNSENNVKLYAEPYLKIVVKGSTVEDGEAQSLTFDIEPKIKYVASTAETAAEITAENSVSLTTEDDLKVENKTLTMSIELPTGFAVYDKTSETYKPVYIEHIKDSTVYRYTAKVTKQGTDKVIATFENPHGFSEFVVTTAARDVAVGPQTYSSIANALSHAQANSPATIKLLGNVEAGDTIEILAGKDITFDLNGNTIVGSITNNGSLTIKDESDEETGNVNGKVTNNKNATISGGTVTEVKTVASGTTTVTGGKVITLTVDTNGKANVTGGEVGSLTTEESGTATVNGGTIASITSKGKVNVKNGTVTGTISRQNNGTVNISGGKIENWPADGVVTVPSGYYYDTSSKTVKPIPTPSVSTNNYLSGLTISQGTLTPAFDRSTTAYTAEVEYTTDSITVTPVKESTWASLAVDGKTITSGTASEAIALKEGANTITVRVTVESGATKDYTVTVTRKAGPGEEYTKLQKAAADYEAYKNEGYTETTWTAFETALKEAQEALKDTALSEEKAKELHEKLDAAAAGLVLVETPQIESVTVSGNKASVKLTGATENAEGYDYVIGEKGCITAGKYADVLKNKGTSTKFSYVQEGTYYAYCHAWKKVDGKKVFSGWSEGYEFEVEATTVAAPKITSVKVKGKTVTITVKNAKGTAGIDTVLGKTILKDQYGKYPSGYGKLVIKNKKTTTIIFKNVPKGTYYAGTHAFTRFGSTNTKVFSKWSNIKKVVVK